MKFTIINGTNRVGNKSIEVSKVVGSKVNEMGHEARLITLDNFDLLFRGEYIDLSNANDAQKTDLENMLWANVLLFVAPTYHHGIPGSLKNFLDIVNDVSVYEGKVIGCVAVGKSFDGIRQTRQVIDGILSYNKINSFILPKECLLALSDIDMDRVKEYINYCIDFRK